MKAKSFMLLLATLFILPVSEAAITKKRRIIHYKESVRRERITTRVPIDYTIETTGDENGLQIIFLFPMHEADITVTDKNGNVVRESNKLIRREGTLCPQLQSLPLYLSFNIPCCRHHGRNHIRGRELIVLL